jgi:hypothetical protein
MEGDQDEIDKGEYQVLSLERLSYPLPLSLSSLIGSLSGSWHSNALSPHHEKAYRSQWMSYRCSFCKSLRWETEKTRKKERRKIRYGEVREIGKK